MATMQEFALEDREAALALCERAGYYYLFQCIAYGNLDPAKRITVDQAQADADHNRPKVNT